MQGIEAAESTSCEIPQALNGPAITSPGSGVLLWVRRARGVFSGLSYVIVVSATYYFVPWLLGDVVEQSSGLSPATFLSHAQQVAGPWAALLPACLLTVVGVNLAPRAGTRRMLWLGCTLLLGWIVNRLARSVPFEHNAAWLAGFGDGMLNAALLMAVCVYHSHAQRAADSLLQTQIRRATLGAELRRAQLQFLRVNGCHFGQGRLFGDPCTAEELLALLATQAAGGAAPFAHLLREGDETASRSA